MTASSGAPATPLLRVIDLETTGQGYGDGGVVEIGWQDLVLSTDRQTWDLSGAPGARLVNPGHPISPSTSAIHHIIDEDVADAPAFHLATPTILRAQGPLSLLALVAHRAAFEQRWCLPALTGRTPWICTYKCALRLCPTRRPTPTRACVIGGARPGWTAPWGCRLIAPAPMPM